jgi:hypothetical protein
MEITSSDVDKMNQLLSDNADNNTPQWPAISNILSSQLQQQYMVPSQLHQMPPVPQPAPMPMIHPHPTIGQFPIVYQAPQMPGAPYHQVPLRNKCHGAFFSTAGKFLGSG